MKRSEEVEETGRRGTRTGKERAVGDPLPPTQEAARPWPIPTHTVELERAFSRGPGAVDSPEEDVTKAIQNSKGSVAGILSIPCVAMFP